MKNVKKKELEIILQKIKQPEKIKVELEQYSTPASIASDILWRAYYNGDIEGRFVIDLGCGTGIFSIGCALLNAKRVVGIDVDDEIIEMAKKEAKKFNVHVEFISKDIEEFNEKGDVVVMNPPFGAQYSNRKADKIFIEKSMELSNVFYSLHLKDSANFIKKFVEERGWKIIEEKNYKFPIKASLPFHEKKVEYYNVLMIHGKRM
ncbi:MAG TPA: methyltransferase domain-containing protein [Thermoplasmatales archaeon]|nr:methyltransferase domain-containing protein [Thermoplasmatales archaeon]